MDCLSGHPARTQHPVLIGLAYFQEMPSSVCEQRFLARWRVEGSSQIDRLLPSLSDGPGGERFLALPVEPPLRVVGCVPKPLFQV